MDGIRSCKEKLRFAGAGQMRVHFFAYALYLYLLVLMDGYGSVRLCLSAGRQPEFPFSAALDGRNG